MQTTFANGLGFSFYGKANRSGVPAYDNNGNIRTVGGYISEDNTVEAKFGVALFATTDKPNAFIVGKSVNSPTVFRGILMNSYRVNENLPAHADHLLNTQPADAIYEGAVWVALNDFADATVGASVNALDADGTLQVATGTDIGAKIVELDSQAQLALIHFE